MPIRNWSTTAANNNSAPPNGWPEGMAPSAVNDTARQGMADVRAWYEDAQWIDFGHTPTRVDDDTFTVTSDQTATYHVGRRVKMTGGSTGYATITASVFGAVTTVDVLMDSGNVPNPLSTVAVSIITATNSSIPGGLSDIARLSQSNTFTSAGTSTAGVRLSSATPVLVFNETDAAADNRLWRLTATGEAWAIETVNDAIGASANIMIVQRTGTTVDSITFGGTTFAVSGVATFTSGTGPIVSNSAPHWRLDETDAAADERHWLMRANSGAWLLSLATDAAPTTPATNAIQVDRTGTVVDSVTLGGASAGVPLLLFSGSASASSGGWAMTGNGTAAGFTASFTLGATEAILATNHHLDINTSRASGQIDLTTTSGGFIRTMINSTEPLRCEENTARIGTALRIENAISPANLTADTHNWNPTGLASAAMIRFTADVGLNLTGIAAPTAGRVLWLVNVGTAALTLPGNDVGSTAANRFFSDTGADTVIGSFGTAELWYDTTTSRWRVIGGHRLT